MQDMPRRKKDSASVTLTIRMTQEDRELLDRLVEKRSLELSDEGLSVTATSVIRGMIRREARSLGLLPALGGPSAIGSPPPPNLQSPALQEDSVRNESLHEAPSLNERRVAYPMSIPTPMVPTGLSEPRELRPPRHASARFHHHRNISVPHRRCCRPPASRTGHPCSKISPTRPG